MNISIFPEGVRASSEYFTGVVWLNILVPTDATNFYAVANVTFEPGGRTNWHTHPAGQILLITEGTGFYQEKQKQARALAKGDVVVISPDVEHWHGATRNSRLIHIAITNSTEAGPVAWLQPVTDDEYNSCHSANL